MNCGRGEVAWFVLGIFPMLLVTYFLLALHVSGHLLSNYGDMHFLDGKMVSSFFPLFQHDQEYYDYDCSDDAYSK
jgi:hypothetical protein